MAAGKTVWAGPAPMLAGLALAGALTAAGCSSQPAPADDGTAVRMSAEALYNEAPWVGARPTNIAGATNLAVGTLQGLASASAAYQQQLALNNQAQYAYLSNPSANQQRSRSLTECLDVGGGRQGGIACERMGYESFQAAYGAQATASLQDELAGNEWPPRDEGWTQARQPLITGEEMEAIFRSAIGISINVSGATQQAGETSRTYQMQRAQQRRP